MNLSSGQWHVLFLHDLRTPWCQERLERRHPLAHSERQANPENDVSDTRSGTILPVRGESGSKEPVWMEPFFGQLHLFHDRRRWVLTSFWCRFKFPVTILCPNRRTEISSRQMRWSGQAVNRTSFHPHMGRPCQKYRNDDCTKSLSGGGVLTVKVAFPCNTIRYQWLYV